jgi:hypothetical protein
MENLCVQRKGRPIEKDARVPKQPRIRAVRFVDVVIVRVRADGNVFGDKNVSILLAVLESTADFRI